MQKSDWDEFMNGGDDRLRILHRMEELLKELADNHKPTFIQDGPVGTLLDVIGRQDLNATQKIIILYLIFNGDLEATPQRNIYTTLGITNKTARENLQVLANRGFIKRGTRAHTWEIC